MYLGSVQQQKPRDDKESKITSKVSSERTAKLYSSTRKAYKNMDEESQGQTFSKVKSDPFLFPSKGNAYRSNKESKNMFRSMSDRFHFVPKKSTHGLAGVEQPPTQFGRKLLWDREHIPTIPKVCCQDSHVRLPSEFRPAHVSTCSGSQLLSRLARQSTLPNFHRIVEASTTGLCSIQTSPTEETPRLQWVV